MLGLSFCARAFSSCGERGPLFIAVRGPFTVAASLVAGHRLQMRRLSSCGSRGQLLRGMWDLPRSGLEPVSPALAGRFSTTAPPGKPLPMHFYHVGICFKSTEGGGRMDRGRNCHMWELVKLGCDQVRILMPVLLFFLAGGSCHMACGIS